jgi:hypothetical protein
MTPADLQAKLDELRGTSFGTCFRRCGKTGLYAPLGAGEGQEPSGNCLNLLPKP